MKKLDPVNKEDFLEVQEYFTDKSLENGRTAFKIRTQMLEDIPGNFKNKFKNECEYCDLNEIMSQSHCLTCTAWTDIRKNLDMTRIEDLVTFFKRMLMERAKDKSDV